MVSSHTPPGRKDQIVDRPEEELRAVCADRVAVRVGVAVVLMGASVCLLLVGPVHQSPFDLRGELVATAIP